MTYNPAESGSLVAFFSIERSYRWLSESVSINIPSNIERGKRSITLLFLYSHHLRVIRGKDAVRIFISFFLS